MDCAGFTRAAWPCTDGAQCARSCGMNALVYILESYGWLLLGVSGGWLMRSFLFASRRHP